MTKSVKKTVPEHTDKEKVSSYMAELQHPLKAGIERVRKILNTTPGLSERIKWAAPSYHYKGIDLVTFNHRNTRKVHLVFHHIAITRVISPLLEGAYKDRRMLYLEDEKDITAHAGELQRIMQEYTALIDSESA